MHRILYADRRVDRREAGTLAERHKRLQVCSMCFELFFYISTKMPILELRRIGNKETQWLRELLLHTVKIDEARHSLRESESEANPSSAIFEDLWKI